MSLHWHPWCVACWVNAGPLLPWLQHVQLSTGRLQRLVMCQAPQSQQEECLQLQQQLLLQDLLC
jgi:hypothetical protein